MKLTMISNMEPFGAPFAPKKKEFNFGFIGNIASFLGQLASSVASVVNTNSTNNANAELNEENIALQKETNDLNAALVREQNAQNYKMFEEQNAFNLDMWNKQNEYNDPKEQVRRLLAAGINPSAGLGQAVPASSLTSASALGANAPHLESPKANLAHQTADFSGFGNAAINAVNAWNSSRLADSEIKHKGALTNNVELENTLKSGSMRHTIKLLQEQARKEGILGDMAKEQLDLIRANFDAEVELRLGDTVMQKKNLKLLDEQIRNQQINNDILNVQRAYADKINKGQLAQIWSAVKVAKAQIGLINSNRLLTDSQRETEIQRKVGVTLDNGLKGLDYEVQNGIKDAIMSSAFSDAELKRWQAIDMLKGGVKNSNSRGVSDLIDFANPEGFIRKSAEWAKRHRRGMPIGL